MDDLTALPRKQPTSKPRSRSHSVFVHGSTATPFFKPQVWRVFVLCVCRPVSLCQFFVVRNFGFCKILGVFGNSGRGLHHETFLPYWIRKVFNKEFFGMTVMNQFSLLSFPYSLGFGYHEPPIRKKTHAPMLCHMGVDNQWCRCYMIYIGQS